MAGEIQLNSVSFATESSGTITVNNGTIGSSVVFPSGHVVQTVFNTASAETTFTTNTPTAVTDLTKSITLKTNNPYILIILALNSGGKHSSNTSLGIRLTANDHNALDIKVSDTVGFTNNNDHNFCSVFQTYFHNLTNDSAGATVTYTPKFYSSNNSATSTINPNVSGSGALSQIILMEVQK